jgi:hypothetical protein
MEIFTVPVSHDTTRLPEADDAPRPGLEEQEMDILAFELWQQANCLEIEPDNDWPGEEQTLRRRASCL